MRLLSPASAWRSLPRPRPESKALVGTVAIVVLAVASSPLVRNTGCSPNAHYSLVRALDRGTPRIDRYQWQTCDKSYIDGHFYAAKAPGLALAALPMYDVLHRLGLARENPPSVQSLRAGHDDLRTAVWPLTLWAVLLPGTILLLLVRRVADDVAPGYGAATAITVGVATLMLPYASVFFAHSLSTVLAFGAFALLWGERRGPPRLVRPALAGLLAGFAASTEYPLALLGVLLGIYAVRRRPRLRRGLAYAAGAAVGIVPLVVYDVWAWGTPVASSYADVVINQGQTGHDTLGLNASGFFGVGVPSFHEALALLLGAQGLLRLAPVLALAAPGLVLLYRRGLRAEALLVGVTTLAYLTYDSGYWQPFGGDAVGTRFLIPTLPFLALPLALTFRRLGATTITLAVPSAAAMVALAATPVNWIGDALHEVRRANFAETLLSLAGAGHGWLALTPVLAALALACVLGALATDRIDVSRRSGEIALAALASWLLVEGVAPPLLERSGVVVDAAVVALVAACAAVTAAVADRGLWALLLGCPLIVLVDPALSRRGLAVLLASLVALLLAATVGRRGGLRAAARASG